MKVLIVDDNRPYRAFIEDALRQEGLEFKTTNNQLEAFKVLKQEGAGFSVLLTDLENPSFNGCQLAQKALELFPEMKVIIHSFSPLYALEEETRAKRLENRVILRKKPETLEELESLAIRIRGLVNQSAKDAKEKMGVLKANAPEAKTPTPAGQHADGAKTKQS